MRILTIDRGGKTREWVLDTKQADAVYGILWAFGNGREVELVQNLDAERTTGQLYQACVKAEHKVKELEQDIARLRDENERLARQLDDERFKEACKQAPIITERVVYVPYVTSPYPAPWQTPYVVTCGQTGGTKDCSVSEYGSGNAKMKA